MRKVEIVAEFMTNYYGWPSDAVEWPLQYKTEAYSQSYQTYKMKFFCENSK